MLTSSDFVAFTGQQGEDVRNNAMRCTLVTRMRSDLYEDLLGEKDLLLCSCEVSEDVFLVSSVI